MKKDWKFGQTEDQTSVREPEKEGAGEVRGWPVPVSLTERTSRTNSENTCWVQASLFYKAWVILGRDGKSFLKELSLIAKKKTGPKFSIFPFSAFPPSQTTVYMFQGLKPEKFLREMNLHVLPVPPRMRFTLIDVDAKLYENKYGWP